MSREFRSMRRAEPAIVAQQRLALERPCRLAIETMHPSLRFFYGGHSVVLSVNTGYE
jgi:hypothetical protein